MENYENSGVHQYVSVPDAYAKKSIFVTGATGFLGKVFIEKILYSCPKISKIYILIRGKGNTSVEERIKNMFELPLFDRLRRERPHDMKKVYPIAGDITIPNLGIKAEDEDMLVKTVSMVFHIAATVKFTEPLHTALKINVKGTKQILELCQRIHDIKAFVYVSTVFSNTKVEVLKEFIYPPPIPLEEAESLLEGRVLSEEETIKILNGSFNTYTFTKGIAEQMVEKYRGSVPTVVVRPSIVLSTLAEPIAGWVDNFFAANRVIVSTAQGINWTMLTDYSFNLDLIPVDFVASLVVVAAAKCNGSKNVAVYNICTSDENPITIGKAIQLSMEYCVKHKYRLMPFSLAVFTQSKWLLDTILRLQKLAALLADTNIMASGEKPRLMKYQSAAIQAVKAGEKFTSRTWMISAEQTCALFDSLSNTDQKCFAFHPRNIVWTEYISNYMEAVQRYVFGSTNKSIKIKSHI